MRFAAMKWARGIVRELYCVRPQGLFSSILGWRRWHLRPRALLALRVVIVPADFNRDNGIQIDWEKLAAGIEAAPALSDIGFVSKYYGVCLAA
jgi:hypothetical protein